MKKGKIGSEILLALLEPGMFFIEQPHLGADPEKLNSECRVLFIISIEAQPIPEDPSVHHSINLETGLFWNISSLSFVRMYVPSEEQKLASIPYRA